MSKKNRLKEKFTAFVGKLSPDEVREQLVLAYLQMERCRRVLRGERVEPVAMLDNGESTDLELFYRCKKVSEERDLLENALQGDCVLEEAIGELTGIFGRILNILEGDSGTSESHPIFDSGDEVWYLFGDRVQHSRIDYQLKDIEGSIVYRTKLGHTAHERDLFGSIDLLFNSLKKKVNE